MRAMLLETITDFSVNKTPLSMKEIEKPEPAEDEVLIKISVCGVCHTELDEIEGRTPPPELPVVPGHQAVGIIVAAGSKVKNLKIGDRAGVAWIFSACGQCRYCQEGNENLCGQFKATGRDAHGGYAEFMKVSEAFAHPIPAVFNDAEAAPLLCAGAIGYRALRLTKLANGKTLGLTGFGASGHLVMKMARHLFPQSKIFVFARSEKERMFSLELGADWAGDTAEQPPELTDAIIDTTPVWKPIVEAMSKLKPGGRLVINAIRKEDFDKDYLLKLHYPQHLWMEKEIKSVANITRKDVREFLQLAAHIPIKPEFQEYPLEKANEALLDLKQGHIKGAKVLRIY
ncbi:MAG TPA: zinc-dependent alcohol dehydrogenase family protein [Chitinophagales bacterium]|nr:zinc-dependent alcohol dehydrogenase family protein [Chitinophagales bacterium]